MDVGRASAALMGAGTASTALTGVGGGGGLVHI